MTTENSRADALTGQHVHALMMAQAASCTCLTKTPDPQYHDAACRYRLLAEVIDFIEHRSSQPAAAPIEYRYEGGTHWCDLGPAERMRPDFKGVYRLKAGTFPVWDGEPAPSPADERAAELPCEHQWTWADGKCADCGAATHQPTPTTDMTLVERISHVGGRVTEDGCIEFGSAMAIDALIQHVLLDARAASSIAPDDGRCYAPACGKWDGNDTCTCARAASANETDDQRTAIEFYVANPSAALLDFTARVSRNRAASANETGKDRTQFDAWFADAWAKYEDKDVTSEIKSKVWALKAWRHFARARGNETEAEGAKLIAAVAKAYGYLYHVNDLIEAPIPLYSPSKASYAARRVLREFLTNEQRGMAINEVGREIGRFVDDAERAEAVPAQAAEAVSADGLNALSHALRDPLQGANQ